MTKLLLLSYSKKLKNGSLYFIGSKDQVRKAKALIENVLTESGTLFDDMMAAKRKRRETEKTERREKSHKLQIDIPNSCLGRIIGPKGSNITALRELAQENFGGIMEIEIPKERSKAPNGKTTVTVYGQSEEAIKWITPQLTFYRDTRKVEAIHMGRVIGKINTLKSAVPDITINTPRRNERKGDTEQVEVIAKTKADLSFAMEFIDQTVALARKSKKHADDRKKVGGKK